MSDSIRNTKIVATLGPTSDSPEVIRKLIAAGVNVFRVNSSHGTQAEHGARIQTVRALAKEAGVTIGILMDLQGPKIRLGKFEGGHAMLETGAAFSITTEECLGTAQLASTSYVGFAADVKPGNRVLLADGSIELRAVRSDGKTVECTVVIDLQQTVAGLQAAMSFVSDLVANGGRVLFVGTKKQAQESVREEAERAELLRVSQGKF